MLYMINHGAVSYGANTILTNINFEINAGQKIAVVGRNGCGKTTLLKLIEGEVALEKRDSDEDIYRKERKSGDRLFKADRVCR